MFHTYIYVERGLFGYFHCIRLKDKLSQATPKFSTGRPVTRMVGLLIVWPRDRTERTNELTGSSIIGNKEREGRVRYLAFSSSVAELIGPTDYFRIHPSLSPCFVCCGSIV